MRHPDDPSLNSIAHNFGIFSLSSEQMEPKISDMDWVLNIDRSGSMGETCADGKTKMQHIHHTLKNMVDYFIKLPTTIKQTLTIISFDHEVEILCEKITIDASLKTTLTKIIAQLEPRGATNIGVALASAMKIIEPYRESRAAAKSGAESDSATATEPSTSAEPSTSETQTMHIFMSDGQITTGVHDKIKLTETLTKSNTTKCHHAFVGFGIHHDDALLRHLSDATGGDYYFIDSLENAGMVYGEILYVGLYEYIQSLNVTIENGEFYNYKTNTWSKMLMVDSIASGQTRTWHIRTPHHDVSEHPSSVDEQHPFETAAHHATHRHISIQGTYHTIDNTATQTLPPTDIEYPSPSTINKDVEKYHWRQRTQELMYTVKQFIAETTPERSSLYPGAYNMVGYKNTLHNMSPPLPKPPIGKFDQEAHLILDAAKQGVWSAVWAMLDKNPSLVNELPNPRNFRLIHQAVYQQNAFALQTLLNRGAKITALTSDGKNINQIVSDIYINKDVRNIIDRAYGIEKQTNDKDQPLSPEEQRKEYGNQLDTFLQELKEYMAKNDLCDDAFMQTLSDDIYITIRSLTSKYGGMYIHTRSSSQGRERAYNTTNITRLESDTTEAYRSLGGNHGVSQSNTTSYASPVATDLMRQVSS
tara:strand:+ start:515 stop:2449 length:1935 start_codon:yes stop_codon:yes gene_type:complete